MASALLRFCVLLYLFVATSACVEQDHDGSVQPSSKIPSFEWELDPSSAEADHESPKRDEAPTAEGVANASLHFIQPTSASLTNPMLIAVIPHGPVVRVEYRVDQGLPIGQSDTASQAFSIVHSFLGSGGRVIEAIGYDASGAVVATASKQVQVPAPELVAMNYSEPTAFVAPLTDSVSNPVVFRVVTSSVVERVRYEADDVDSDSVWSLGESTDRAGGFELDYSFSHGGLRTVRAVSYDAMGTVVGEVQRNLHVALTAPATVAPTCKPGEVQDCNGACAKAHWINDGYCDDGSGYSIVFTCPALGMDGNDCGQQVSSPCPAGHLPDCAGTCAKSSWIHDGICDDGKNTPYVLTCAAFAYDGSDCEPGPPPASKAGAGSVAVPYFYQYANQLSPAASCQNTSIAMVLKHLGWSGTPDTITAAWGKNIAQSPAGLAKVFNHYAEQMGISQRLQPHTQGTLAGLQSLLKAGKPVIIHGYFTGYGHVMVTTGYDGASYTVNDPAGKWAQSFKGGYPYGWSPTVGQAIHYSAAAFESAVATSNGSAALPLWYHELLP